MIDPARPHVAPLVAYALVAALCAALVVPSLREGAASPERGETVPAATDGQRTSTPGGAGPAGPSASGDSATP